MDARRVLSLLAAAILIQSASPAEAAGESDRPVALAVTSPERGAAISLQPHVTSLSGAIRLRGRALQGHVVAASTRCAVGMCRRTATADRKGRWTMALDVVVGRGSRNATVLVTDTSDASGPGTRVALRLDEPQPESSGIDPRAPLLAVIGDSLAVGTTTMLPLALPGWRVTSAAREGRALGEGMDLLAATPVPRRPIVLALSLFTNDDPSNLAALESAVRTSVARVAPSGCAVWATISRPPLRGAGYATANALLRRLAADPLLGRSMRLVDWSRAVREHRGWLTADRVHPTAAGRLGRTAMYAQAARSCPSARAVSRRARPGR